jgi:hypothetical protein
MHKIPNSALEKVSVSQLETGRDKRVQNTVTPKTFCLHICHTSVLSFVKTGYYNNHNRGGKDKKQNCTINLAFNIKYGKVVCEREKRGWTHLSHTHFPEIPST